MIDRAESIRVGDGMTLRPRGKKKIYCADFQHDGAHRRVSLKSPNKKVATARAVQLAAELLQHTYRMAPKSIDIHRAAEDYVAALKTGGRGRKTIVKYRGIFKNFTEFLGPLRATKLDGVTPSHFDAWRRERIAIRHPKTVYTESVIVKQLFRWAKGRRLILDDPLAGLKLDKPRRQPKMRPSFEQVEAILAAAADPLRYHLTVLAFTGMRLGELQRLRVEDVDFVDNWIHIVSRPGAETKTRDSRKVPMHPRLRAVLSGIPKPAGPLFFASAPSAKFPGGGNCLNPKRVHGGFIAVVKALGLPAGRASGLVTHSLRHFFETFTVNTGIPQMAVDTWLGHSSNTSMAAQYYGLGDADSQAFMRKVPFGGAIRPASSEAQADRADTALHTA